MRPFPAPLALTERPGRPGAPSPDPASPPGPVTRQHHPQMLFATESLTQALRQLELYGRDGLSVISADGQHLQGWITSQNVLQAVACHLRAAPAAAQAQPAHPTASPPATQMRRQPHYGRLPHRRAAPTAGSRLDAVQQLALPGTPAADSTCWPR